MTQTCMCWGIDCGDGWYWLIDRLCAAIQGYVDGKNGEVSQVEAAQVKEKFGTLRFYVDGADEHVRSWIQYTEYLSAHICEECGHTEGAEANTEGGRTHCPWCRKVGEKSDSGRDACSARLIPDLLAGLGPRCPDPEPVLHRNLGQSWLSLNIP